MHDKCACLSNSMLWIGKARQLQGVRGVHGLVCKLAREENAPRNVSNLTAR